MEINENNLFKTDVPMKLLVSKRYCGGEVYLMISISEGRLVLLDKYGEIRFASPNEYTVLESNDILENFRRFLRDNQKH